MIERTTPPVAMAATRVGRNDLGEATAAIDDDVLVVLLRAAPEERQIRVQLSMIDTITLRGNELQISLRDGPRLTMVGKAASLLRDELAVRCRAIPELTRALRAFGSRRGHRSERASGPSEQQRFFAPLLNARRKAMNTDAPLLAMAAFDAPALGRAITLAVSAFSSERHAQNAPARRALEAELADLVEPLQDALALLHRAAADVEAARDDLPLWRAWASQLRATFEVADRVWLSLDAALDTTVRYS